MREKLILTSHVTITMISALLLSSCGFDAESSKKTGTHPTNPDLVTPEVTPVRPPPDLVTPEIETMLPLIESKSQSRSEAQGYVTNDITISQPSPSQLIIHNSTPRILHQPIISVDGRHYRVNTTIDGFEDAYIASPNAITPITEAFYVDEQPFFNVEIVSFSEDAGKPIEFPMPTEFQRKQYGTEIIAFKSLFGDFNFSQFFVQYIESYMNSSEKLLGLTPSTSWCNHEADIFEGQKELHEAQITKLQSFNEKQPTWWNRFNFKSKDYSDVADKLLSAQLHQPEATYYTLNRSGIAGQATNGDGWLAIDENYYLQEGQQVSTLNTYFHEKMHNHGFSHGGGMTYGLDRSIRSYILDGNWEYFSDAQWQAKNTQTLIANIEQIREQNKVTSYVYYTDKYYDSSKPTQLTNFIITANKKTKIKKVGFIDQFGIKNELLPSANYADGKLLIFSDIEPLNTYKINTKNPEVKLFIESSIPTDSDQAITVVAGSSLENNLQASAYIPLDGTIGFSIDSNRFAFYNKVYSKNADGKYKPSYRFFTPNEAQDFCQEKGLTLGELGNNARDQIDLQMKFLPYQSQVGLFFGEAVAYNVPTGAYVSKITKAESGILVVCKNVNSV